MTDLSSSSITSFHGEYDWLSNFYQHDKRLSAEHAYQAAKTFDGKWKAKILGAKTPGKAKRLGSKAPIRHDWNSIRLDVMINCVRDKFEDSILSDKLVETYPRNLVEGNGWHDNYWGNCTCDDCQLIEGLNMLGFILMTVRAEIIQSRKGC